MKNVFLILVTVMLYVSAFGQSVPHRDTLTRRTISITHRAVDTNILIDDENGNPLHYYQYNRLINSGEYTMKYNGPPGIGKPVITKISPAVKAMMIQQFSQSRIETPALQIGKELDIAPLLDAVDKTDLDKKVVVLVFWEPDCPPCTEAFAGFNDLIKQLQPNPQDIIILAITHSNGLVAMGSLAKKPLLNARLIGDANAIFTTYNLIRMPAYVVTDKNHIIQFTTEGQRPLTMPMLKDAIGKALSQ